MLSQKDRIIALVLYLILEYLVAIGLYGTWLFPSDGFSLWFYTAIFGLLFSDLLLAPFFTKLADVLATSAVCAFALLAYRPTDFTQATFGVGFWSLASVWVISSFLLATTIIFRSKRVIVETKPKWDLARNTALEFGSARYLFTLVFIYSILQFHRTDPSESTILALVWFSIFTLRPLEKGIELRNQYLSSRKVADPQAAGFLLARQEPNVSLLQSANRDAVGFGVPILINAGDGKTHFGITLDTQWLAAETWIRVLRLETVDGSVALQNISHRLGADIGKAIRVSDTSLPDALKETLFKARQDFVGLVAADTDLTTLRFDVLRDHESLREGQLVRTRIGTKEVLYQIVGGLTAEEILYQKNTVGFARAIAKKIGVWSEKHGRFEMVRWIPVFNEPVFLVQPSDHQPVREAIGFFPDTSYEVRIDPHTLVTHNTAVLGILGSGKTYLVYELIERVQSVGAKVLCLDITTKYAQHLVDLTDEKKTNALRTALKYPLGSGKSNVQQNKEEGGSVVGFSEALETGMKAFIEDADWKVLILNPFEFQVWRQTSNPYQNTASMSSLSVAEITQLITEAVLRAIPKGDTEEARVCIVYEEAHSLIPEWNSAVHEGDQRAALGTAKSVMQGRKFGLGAIVVTQRTANVTKSILSQCNTLFGFRVYDATGMEYLRNFVGTEYAEVLSALEDRHVVVFGRASSCRQPVLIRVNDRDDFLKVFRPAQPLQ